MDDIDKLIEYLKENAKEMTVLYVEDEVEVRNKTLKILENFFSQVDYAVNGNDGIEKYNNFKKQNTQYYDLVITDILMPFMSGTKMSQLIYTLNPQQYIIVFTAYNDIEIRESLFELGIDGFIQKPLSIEIFIQSLVKAVDQISKDKKY